jgi:transmembrane sensor
MNPLGTLKHDVEQVRDDPDRAARDVAAARARLFGTPAARRAPLRPRAWLAAAVILVVLLPVVALKALLFKTTPNVAVALRANEGVVRLPDGSTVNVSRARATILPESDHRIRVQIERGEAAFSVVHHDDTRWEVEAGPFTVVVVGTRFECAWDPDRREFWLRLAEGAVRVRGPAGLDQLMRAGEFVRAAVGEQRVQWDGPLRSATEPALGHDASADARSTGNDAATTADVITVPRPASSSAAWITMLRAGRTREALSRAQSDGFGRSISVGDPEALMLLADIARAQGQSEQARAAWAEVRARFGRSAQAGASRFLEGRLLADQLHQPDQARAMFERYLIEQPSGPFAESARARLLAEYTRLDERGATRTQQLARDYLRLHPEGPSAWRARAILGDSR